MNKVLENEKGVALVVTLGIVSVLIAAALQLGKYTGESVMAGLVDKDQFQAEQFALSGIDLAKLLLAEDAKDNAVDSVQDDWADPDKLSQAIRAMGIKQEELEIMITDELSKIQVNALIYEYPGAQVNAPVHRILDQFFRLRFSVDKAEDERDPEEILNSLKDWLDANDDDAVSGLSGAESDYYLGLEPPYECANGPLNHIDELYSVKGVTKDILVASGEEDLEEISTDLDEDQDLADPAALGDFFTVFGLIDEKGEQGGYRYSGKVNINTASQDVLAAVLPEGMDDLAADLVDFRLEKGEEDDVFVNALDKGWYKKVIDLSEKEQARLDQVVTYSSNIYTVECRAARNDARQTLVAVLQREKDEDSGKWTCRVIQMMRKE